MKGTGTRTIVALAGALAIGTAGFWLARRFTTARQPSVYVEAIEKRDLKAAVSASGRIQQKRSVDISASTVGRVAQLAVDEGDQVTTRQFLLQIDPKSLQTVVQRGRAGLEAARSALRQAKAAVEAARVNLGLARDTLERQRELSALNLTTPEALDRAASEAQVRASELRAREAECSPRSSACRANRPRWTVRGTISPRSPSSPRSTES